jgi:chitin disaccharide deacetylase
MGAEAAAPRRLVLCADDFGASRGISEGIARLAHAGRLSAVACLTNGADWPAGAPLLRGLPGGVGVGLHFNLTEGRPLSAALAARWPQLPALPRLIALAHARRLPTAELHAEWLAQLGAFTQAHGGLPAMVDGHQHVHHLPGVREVVLRGVQALGAGGQVFVRGTGRVAGPGFAVKRQLIARTGGRRLQRLLGVAGVPHNRWLLGVYDFRADDYGALMRAWLAEAPMQGGLLFCHPGAAEAGDAIGPARARELAYLGSAAFEADLAASRTRLVAPAQLGPA